MIPVLTPAEMAEVDRSAPESTEALVRLAAGAVARTSAAMLGGTYGRRVIVIAGPGNNGADGRVAAQILANRGVRVQVLPADIEPRAAASVAKSHPPHLLIDAAFGTGFRGSFNFPLSGVAPVLAVDLSSGLSGLTGESTGQPARAARTVTFAALKPGLLLGAGPEVSGSVTLADIGLDVSHASIHVVEDGDTATWLPGRATDSHKWRHAVWLVAGSPGMSGAAELAASAAFRSGAGYVRLSTPGDDHPDAPTEAVTYHLGADWAHEVAEGAARFGCVAVGPGLGRSEAVRSQVRALCAQPGFPLVIDGDALVALGEDAAEVLHGRGAPTVLTPHDGEFKALVGRAPSPDRIAEVRSLAARVGAHVLLKGSATIVSSPTGEVFVVNSGGPQLATAGTGDVLTGMISANLAMGAEPLRAAAAAAHIHGRITGQSERGVVAGDLVRRLPRILAVCLDTPTSSSIWMRSDQTRPE